MFNFLINHLPAGFKKAELTELEENNVLLLSLGDPGEEVLVDLLADELPGYIEKIDDYELREAFRPELTTLAENGESREARPQTAIGQRAVTPVVATGHAGRNQESR